MKAVPVSVLKNNLSAILKKVKQGNSVIVSEHGHLIAQILPTKKSKNIFKKDRLILLQKEGLISLPEQDALDPTFWSEPLVKTTDGSSVLAALLEEREESR